MVKQKLFLIYILLIFVPVLTMKKTSNLDEYFRLYDSQSSVHHEIYELFEKVTLADDPGKMVQRCYKEKSFDINIQHPDTHNTLLHCFVRAQLFNAIFNWKIVDLGSFKFFFDNKADPNVRNGRGYSILHTALESNHCSDSLLKILLEHKADPNQQVNGLSPLSILLEKEHYRDFIHTAVVTNLLLEFKADPNWQKKHNGERVFDVVMGKNRLNFLLVEPFIKNGVNPCRYYDYEQNLSYDKIDPNRSYEHRIAYLMYLNAIPAWMLQKQKKSLETFLLSLKELKNNVKNIPQPPRRLLEHAIFNYILPGYREIKKAIQEVDENDWIICSRDQQDIDKKIKRFISLYS